MKNFEDFFNSCSLTKVRNRAGEHSLIDHLRNDIMQHTSASRPFLDQLFVNIQADCSGELLKALGLIRIRSVLNQQCTPGHAMDEIKSNWRLWTAGDGKKLRKRDLLLNSFELTSTQFALI